MAFFYMQQDNIDELTDFQSILNFVPIHQNLYTSGQPTSEQLQLIKESGFTIIMNIALTDATNHLEHEDRICLDLGLDYLHIPLLWDCPNTCTGLFVLDLIDHLVQQHKVWLHCARNFRVSSLMYLYRQYYMGIDIVEADQYLHEVWQPNDTWTGFTYAIQQQLQARQITKELQQLS